MTTPGDRALRDLHQIIEGALRTNGALLTAGERALANRMRSLDGDAGRLYVRVLARKGSVFRQDRLAYDDVGSVQTAVEALCRVDLASRLVAWPERLRLYTVDELREICRRRGLRRAGRRADLEQRLQDREGWAEEPVFRVVGGMLVRRLELLWFRNPWRDRTALLLERLGQTRWASYEPTGGGRAFRNRAQFQAYLEAIAGREAAPEAALRHVQGLVPRPPWMRGLDPRRVWASRATKGARLLEKNGERERAHAIYTGLLDAGVQEPGRIAQRLALNCEALGNPRDGAEACTTWLAATNAPQRPALARTGRRLSRKAGLPWRPMPPLKKAPERILELPFADGRWGDGHRVEQAVVERLAPRRSLHGENVFWTTVFGLAFLDLYWSPVAGMLPAPCLAGPIDLGTPAFLDHRRAAIEERMNGPLEPLVRGNHQRFKGCIAEGVRWSLDLEVVATLADMGKPVLWRLLREGWAAARGLPDLAVLPGEAAKVSGLFPGRIPSSPMLVEVKAPNDQVRDEQAVWHDALIAEGVPVEVWRVRPRR